MNLSTHLKFYGFKLFIVDSCLCCSQSCDRYAERRAGYIVQTNLVAEFNRVRIAAVFAAVLGHIFPVFAGFRGGKGVATLVGAVTGIYPPVALLCFGVWFVVLMVSHYVSLASMAAGCCFPLFTLISPKVNQSVSFVVFSFVIAILLIYTHRKNIERLKAGTESKTYIWKPRRIHPAGAAPGKDAAPEDAPSGAG